MKCTMTRHGLVCVCGEGDVVIPLNFRGQRPLRSGELASLARCPRPDPPLGKIMGPPLDYYMII